jgi:response regulator NasT
MTDSTFPNPPGVAALRAAFAAALPTHLEHMRSALLRGDLAAAEAVAHTLSGSAATFGCRRVGEAAAELERACRGADREDSMAAFDKMCAAAQADLHGDGTDESEATGATAAPWPPLILLVDDDALLLAALARALEADGFRVLTAGGGAQALALLRTGQQPHLAVLDIAMPDMSGLELAARLEGVPCMFLSASSDAGVADLAAQGGAVGYLLKPIDPAQLLPAVRAALARAAEIQELRAAEQRLTLALRDGRETGMAVGLLMERYRIDRHGALRMLRGHARSSQRKLNDVAAELLQAAETMNAFATPKPELQAPRPRPLERRK